MSKEVGELTVSEMNTIQAIASKIESLIYELGRCQNKIHLLNQSIDALNNTKVDIGNDIKARLGIPYDSDLIITSEGKVVVKEEHE